MIHTVYARLQELGPFPHSDVAQFSFFAMEHRNGNRQKRKLFAQKNQKRCQTFPKGDQWCSATCSNKHWCDLNFPNLRTFGRIRSVLD
mmetsp:Transcript_588/g.1055  ORF Transcript_588/g.1055 Transcript_588/m.1055 type:complete len:88 (+) Transcript_588:881-1144(+)